MGERPTAEVASAAMITTSRLAARNNSGLLVRAAWENSRGKATRPPISNTAIVSAPVHNVRNSPSKPSLLA